MGTQTQIAAPYKSIFQRARLCAKHTQICNIIMHSRVKVAKVRMIELFMCSEHILQIWHWKYVLHIIDSNDRMCRHASFRLPMILSRSRYPMISKRRHFSLTSSTRANYIPFRLLERPRHSRHKRVPLSSLPTPLVRIMPLQPSHARIPRACRSDSFYSHEHVALSHPAATAISTRSLPQPVWRKCMGMVWI